DVIVPDLWHTTERWLELARKPDYEAPFSERCRPSLGLIIFPLGTSVVSLASYRFIVRASFGTLAMGCVLGETGKPLPAYQVAVSHAMKSSKVWRLRRTASARTVASSRKPSAGSASGIRSSGF